MNGRTVLKRSCIVIVLAVLGVVFLGIYNMFRFRTAMGHANQLYMDRRFEDAASEYQRAINVFPYIGLSHLYRGESLLFLRRSDQARIEIKRAVELEPEDAHYRARLAMADWEYGDFTGAEKEARNAIKLDANEGEAHFTLAKLLVRRRSYREASQELVESLRCSPQDKEVRAAIDSFRKRHPDIIAAP